MAGQPVLPYPHARNDCAGCREQDADVELLDHDGRPRRVPHELCHRCLGLLVASLALTESGQHLDQPVTLRFRPARGRRI
ncbi:hypothetical protein ABJI51_16605 [Amycolatopsis sp. NEAU-NG30]|uniref:Uncharacterized protein n=1 Tax=Amycolatopsis melonis TaxID=3156488 RepID=A0ABV0LFJ4_9PSEU